MMPFEWDVRVSSKDHTVAALYVVNDELATVGYTTLGGTTHLLAAGSDRSCDRRRNHTSEVALCGASCFT